MPLLCVFLILSLPSPSYSPSTFLPVPPSYSHSTIPAYSNSHLPVCLYLPFPLPTPYSSLIYSDPGAGSLSPLPVFSMVPLPPFHPHLPANRTGSDRIRMGVCSLTAYAFSDGFVCTRPHFYICAHAYAYHARVDTLHVVVAAAR